ncbi:MAG: type III pantothenate kinase [Bacteroidales bacterium]|nr:type III pantothenate kinase [Bacteroidales bacterium]
MNLIVEIGNTAVKAALAEGTTLGRTFRYQGERAVEFITSLVRKERPETLTVASTYELSPAEQARLQNSCPKSLIMGDGALAAKYGFPEYLSNDRVASLVAVRYMFAGKNVTLVDFGTTLTVDVMGADGKYLGGNISPGCRTRFKSLSRYAKALPLVDIPENPAPLGSSMTGSIESGVISGILFEIEGYIENYPGNVVVFTGGDAIYFVKRMKSSIFAVCNLVLIGLAIITDDNVEKRLQ